MDTQKFAPRDQKIITDNEGKSPYELLELGLSEKAYNRLLEIEANANTVKVDAPKQESKVKQDSEVVKPNVRAVDEKSKVKHTAPEQYKAQKVAAGHDKVNVLNRRTGKVTTMKASFAARLIKNPNEYAIV